MIGGIMTEDRTVCGVPYRRHDDGRIGLLDASGGETFMVFSDDYSKQSIVKNWQKYGSIMTKLAAEFKIPVAYIIGFTTIESGGNENACASCEKTITVNGVEQQWCAFAPNCAPAGQKQCCAYGLLGVIHANVARLSGGKHSGQDLLGNPELAIRYGVMIFIELWNKFGDVLVAVKRYNGGSPCSGSGVFHMGGQAGTNYVDKFVKAVNTFVAMGLVPPVASASMGGAGNVVLFLGLAAAAWWALESSGVGRRLVSRLSE